MYEGQTGPRIRGDQTWQERAACARALEVVRDPDLFFPAALADDRRVALAKRICFSCQVRATCLETALECGDAHGVRGGMTAEERKTARTRFELRCDPDRIMVALSGRDVHLTRLERQELVRLAARSGTPTPRVAEVLKVSEAHVKKLYRREHHRDAGDFPGVQGETRAAGAQTSA
ncbi:WhiB family transcriptional regulator [Streptomyces sp. Ag109_G2-15]|uniref:WhiB family transcriptional regulator n=1 Tax=Streptomyces sp. Ag109_G2-15 TaxID=1938850 RepID=UPI0015CF1885|nr:WhiB family transcriptional regulator [Streptomyces sp. Ag109_G2-15]